jgi:SAM-dependent methyltransferase
LIVAVNQERATSFGNVAESYDQVRPGPPPEALDWLVPAGCEVAVDLAAGTGLFTRALLGRASRVIAVEPDDRMREVLARRSPEVDVLAGWGESMPLRNESAAAVFVSTAWHWLDTERAVPEIARVLRPGGRLGVIWTSRDRTADWVAELDLLRLPGIRERAAAGGMPRTTDQVREKLEREHTVTLPDGSPFTGAETASFFFTRTVTVDELVAWLATNSAFITASAADRAAGLDRCRAALLDRTEGRTGDAAAVELPMRSWCWRAGRMLAKASGNNQNDCAAGCAVEVSPNIWLWQRTTVAITAVSRGMIPSCRIPGLTTVRRRRQSPSTRSRSTRGHGTSGAASVAA